MDIFTRPLGKIPDNFTSILDKISDIFTSTLGKLYKNDIPLSIKLIDIQVYWYDTKKNFLQNQGTSQKK